MQLIECGRQKSELQSRLEQEQREHDYLEERNTVLERDVRRYEERIALEKRVCALEVRIAFAEFHDSKSR